MKLKSIFISLFVIFFLSFIKTSAQWEPPCATNDCTGDWQEGTEEVWIQSCYGCVVLVHYHYRIANCPNNNPPEEYQFHIDYFEGNYTCLQYNCWNMPNDVEFAQNVLKGFLNIISFNLQDGTIIKLSFASCWGSDLLGPFPLSQPCPNNINCCKSYYGVEGGELYYIGDDPENENTYCPEWEGHDCNYICDPNGYLYKRPVQDINIDAFLTTSIIPNPNNGNFRVTLKGFSKVKFFLEIYNNIGKLVFQETINKNSDIYELTLDLSKFVNGEYNLRITNEFQILTNNKFIIAK